CVRDPPRNSILLVDINILGTFDLW
nr:immunoglobulin heavy chain junction region [Macaca mulatta]MOV87590.1 immunoglobulin heavy chain junction region [Macaca mulatta]MOV88053.1 immunoglobulin heavy chain junction region [Macaca mulatta]MOV88320.1 immunoglobulin heavy chain junction region [Macaca mulatta]MOV88531.1 immunoglobulin heavy chain junction region [Macaca mulatta]